MAIIASRARIVVETAGSCTRTLTIAVFGFMVYSETNGGGLRAAAVKE
jgi:hypothetical protein